jgi:hypothetical protein
MEGEGPAQSLALVDLSTPSSLVCRSTRGGKKGDVGVSEMAWDSWRWRQGK